MTTRVIKTEGDIEALRLLLRARKLPVTVEIVAGIRRTNLQNALQWKWYGEIAAQMGDRTADDVAKYCKLHFGVPILRAESDLYREKYDRLLRGRSYEEKIEFMGEGWPVTSAMTTKQESAYLDAIDRAFSAQGVRLTIPGMDGQQWT
jgi:hypothetical protein